MRFLKYEGLGNDFVVVEVDSPDALSAERVVQLCDRHLGIGADGVLMIAPPTSSRARATMVVINADGSRPEMCGNGLRCVALHVAHGDGGSLNSRGAQSLVIDTDAGPLGCDVEQSVGDAGVSGLVTVDMGVARIVGEHEHRSDSASFDFLRVSTGNPHAIVFGRDVSEAEVDLIGARVSGELEGGSNVEFARLLGPAEIDVVVWERGVGRTRACGTGACATAVAAARLGHVPFDEDVTVRLPGGPLSIRVAQADLRMTMRGPARRVFEGTVSTRWEEAAP